MIYIIKIKNMVKENKRRKLFLNYPISILIILFFAESVSQVLTDDSINSYVIMKMPKGDNLMVFNGGNAIPDEIYINGISKDVVSQYDFNEDENNVTLIWRKNITSCIQMFKDCEYIIEMDFTHFDTSQVTNMLGMFQNCKRLKSLNLSNFDTSNVNNSMHNMFWNCYSLEYIDISNFNTSQIKGFGHMFCNCTSLLSIDLSNFDTSECTTFDYMFYGCKNLTSLNLSNFILLHLKLYLILLRL